MPITPSTKMKQLQWDKLPQTQVTKTFWNAEQPDQETLIIQKLQRERVWLEMEEDFKAKQLVINLMARQKRAELKSVLDAQTKKRVEILIQGVKRLEPEEIAFKIQQFDQELCTQGFLSELKPVLPSPEQIGKLNVYRNADAEELAGLHPSDRLMVKLIQIERLAPRIEGMLYKVTFDETWSLLNEGARKLSDAGRALIEATHFKELMSLILLIGNYMNGTGIKGGAFGFRVSSINKLVDTKSVNNTTLLHFLEKTVSKHFPEMEGFIDELERPAEAYRVNLQDLRKGLGELREGLKNIRQELTDHFADPVDTDKYGTQMWTFLAKASRQVDDLIDDINEADTTFTDAVNYYGEEDRNMTSSEFYAIFKTFLTSYKKCRFDNQAFAEQKSALEKRKLMMEEARANRKEKSEQNEEEGAIMDALLEKLRNGDTVRRRRRPGERPAITLNDGPAEPGNETASMALDMLQRLQSDGFIPPPTPTTNTLNQKYRRRRTEKSFSVTGPSSSLPSSPLATDMSSSFYESANGEDEYLYDEHSNHAPERSDTATPPR